MTYDDHTIYDDPIFKYGETGEQIRLDKSNHIPIYTAVKSSGEMENYETGARRDSGSNKGRYDLIPWDCMERVARHYQNGADKYGDHNWQKGMPSSRYFSSAMRHMVKYITGSRDEDHLAAVIWNVLAIMWNEVHKPEHHDITGEQYARLDQ